MEKQKLLDLDVESLQLICVNPYEVNPVDHQNIVSLQISTDEQSKDEPSTSQQNSPATNGGEFYTPQKREIKLEMEEYIRDLSPYLHPKPKSRNSVDELNTPIFDKNLPGYDINFDYFQSDQHFIKLESDPYGNNLLINNILKNKSIDVKKMNNNNNDYNTISEIDNIQLQNSVASVLSPESDNGSVYDHPNPTPYRNVSGIISYNSLDHHSALNVSSKQETIYSNASSPAADIRRPVSGVTSPESSICSSNCPTPKLSLNVNLRPVENFDLTTPSIIEDVVELENVNFNILEYMQGEAVSCETINIEDLLVETAQINNNPLLSGKGKDIKKSQLQPYVANKRPRKRRLPDDDDEDYVPPGERNRKRIAFEDVSDSDEDEEVEIERKVKTKTRGRPPKRTGSISSDCSKDSGDASKYRELRDKNNEASRRSRLKRKLKEQELETEADELYSKNIKLKAQVEELEKLVTKFREDLFKIMIRK